MTLAQLWIEPNVKKKKNNVCMLNNNDTQQDSKVGEPS